MANIPLQSITFPDLLNIYNVPTMEGIGKSIFPELIAGGLVDLDSYVENSNPYLFAAMPQGAGKVLTGELVGAKVANNQLVNKNKSSFTFNDVTITNNGDGSFTFNGTANADGSDSICYTIQYKQGHKYLITAKGASANLRFYDGYGADGFDEGNGIIAHWNRASSAGYVYFRVTSGVSYNVKVYPMLIDLTQMLGSTIADHIYSLEQGTAGAGVAFFTKYFGNGYRPYDAGSLQGALVSGHKTIGVNQWDEVSESGYYDVADGTAKSGDNWKRSKNAIPCVPNTTYYYRAGGTGSFGGVVFYDAEDSYISGTQTLVSNSFTTPSNARYIRFYTSKNHTDICINISNADINGKYYPYEEHTYDIEPEDLNGIFVLDNGELKADGDVRKADGSKAVRWAKVTLTNTMISYASNNPGYSNVAYAAILKPADSYDKNKGTTNAICQGYGWNPAIDDWDNASKIGSFYGGATFGYYWVGFPHGTTLEQMQTALVGKEVAYKLATPTEGTAEPFEEYQHCNPYGTQQFILDESQVAPIPAGHNTKYFEDPLANIMARLDALENA